MKEVKDEVLMKSPINVSSGVAEDLVIQTDLIQKYLYVQSKNTEGDYLKGMAKVGTQRSHRDNAIVTFT